MQQELNHAYKWLAAGHSIVLAAVTKTWGSAPRPVGSLMVIHEDGQFEGSVSGGCVEGTVLTEAATLVGNAQSKTLEFKVSTEDAWQIGLACGGQIQIQLYPLGTRDAGALLAAIEHLGRRTAGGLVLSKDDSRAFFIPDGYPDTTRSPLSEDAAELTIAIRPQPALFVVGAVHIAQALCPVAVACGYDVTVIDPRGLFVDDRHFGGAKLVQDWPDEHFQKHPIDAGCALATLTHDPKIDDAALIHALKSEAFYIGSLGSKKTHAARLERLSFQVFSSKQLARINGPIGLDIGSKSPAEIAVSIMAQITASKRDSHAF